MRGATSDLLSIYSLGNISIHAPHAGRDLSGSLSDTYSHISIHAPHAGRDKFKRRSFVKVLHFNPRAPCGARRLRAKKKGNRTIFQSTRPMRGATLDHAHRVHGHSISIHAPHAGRDEQELQEKGSRSLFQSTRPMRGATALYFTGLLRYSISIHAPHAGRDLDVTASKPKHQGFQSTRPMRGATNPACNKDPRETISIHAPHAGRDERNGSRCQPVWISIHAPHAGRDVAISRCLVLRHRISIHAPHAGRDFRPHPSVTDHRHFNPRAPCGARRIKAAIDCDGRIFQSTRPMRGATMVYAA